MTVIATGFIPLSPLFIVLQYLCGKATSDFEKNIVQSTGIELQESMGRRIFRRNVTEVMLKIMLKPIQSINQSNNKTLHQSKLKEFPDDTLMLTQDLKFILGRIENIGREDPGYQHFLLFPQCFQKHSSVGDMGLFDKGLSCNLM